MGQVEHLADLALQARSAAQDQRAAAVGNVIEPIVQHLHLGLTAEQRGSSRHRPTYPA
jgi:hypothetical protein